MTAIKRQSDAFEVFSENARKTINSIGEECDGLRARIEEIESKDSAPTRGASFAEKKEAREHVKRFLEWVRKPNDTGRKTALGEFQQKLYEGKAMSIASSADGGYAVPEEILGQIEKLEMKLSPVRRLVRVVQSGTSDFKMLLNLRGAEAGWVGESGPRTETGTPQLREIVPTHGELYAYPSVTEWLLDDAMFDVQSWLAGEIAEQFSKTEGQAVLTGDGSNKPTGMLNTTPVTTEDFASPLRAAAAYQYIACPSTSSPAVAEILPDPLQDLVYSVNSKYRANATWTMNSATAGKIAKLKDAQGRYLWQQSLIAGQPSTLLGYPVEIWEDLDDVGTNKFPVAFGDFSRGYLLVDRTQTRITVDNVTSPGKVKFYVRRREHGAPYNNDAIKFLKITLS
jgi:HK97 family phage major capsid protein